MSRSRSASKRKDFRFGSKMSQESGKSGGKKRVRTVMEHVKNMT